MPSVLYAGGVSGPQLLISGNPFSGQLAPIGGIQLVADRSNSGSLYIGFSGNMTQTSGSFPLSGGGLADGIQLGPGGAYFIPRQCIRGIFSGAGGVSSGMSNLLSGSPFNIFFLGDAAVSGQGRLYWETDTVRA